LVTIGSDYEAELGVGTILKKELEIRKSGQCKWTVIKDLHQKSGIKLGNWLI
jgi:hypothetical protein